MTEVELIDWNRDDRYRVTFTTRHGGTSSGPYGTLNLGLLTGDDPASVLENRRRLCESAGADARTASMSRQVHGARVARAEPTGIVEVADHPRRDGLWSDVPGQAMLALTADCLPIVICRSGPVPALAVLHAGWRGLLTGVVESGLAQLGAGDCRAVIGPGIGPCCYEVGSDVATRFVNRYGDTVSNGSHVDLWQAAEKTLLGAGCADVDRLDLCTVCERDLFFSHRRDRGVTGRQGVIAYVK